MRRELLAAVLLLLIAGCSGNKGTNSSSDSRGMAVAPATMTFRLAATDDRPAEQQFDLSNQGNDTLTCRVFTDANWIELRETLFTVLPDSHRVVGIWVNAGDLAGGIYHDTVSVANNLNPGRPMSIRIDLFLRPDTTYINIYNPVGYATYQGWNGDCHRYTISSDWSFKCYSNSGKSVEVYRLEASSNGPLDQREVSIVMNSGQLLVSHMNFGACGGNEPPFFAQWYIIAYYRYADQQSYVTGTFHN